MYKSKFVMLLVGLLVTSVAFFGFGDTSQVGDDFFDSEWELFVGDHVGSFSSEFGRNFGSHQWSAKLEGFSEQAGDDQFAGFYGMNGIWGSALETEPYLLLGSPESIERYVYLDMGSDARSSLSQSIWMGAMVDQLENPQGPEGMGFDENYELYISTNLAGDKGVYARYETGVLYEDSIAEGPSGRWYGGIASPRAQVGQIQSDNLIMISEGPNSEVGFSLLVTKDSGTHGFVPVADYSVRGTSTLGASIFAGTMGQQNDREVLAGAYLDGNGDAVVGKIETDEGVYLGDVRQFVASGTGTLTVAGSGRSDLYGFIHEAGAGVPQAGINPGSIVTTTLPGADYVYNKGQVTAGFSVGDSSNIIWSFEGGGQE